MEGQSPLCMIALLGLHTKCKSLMKQSSCLSFVCPASEFEN